MVLLGDTCVFAILKIPGFVFTCAHDILIILLVNHISAI